MEDEEAYLFLTGSLGFAKTLTVIVLANASTQDVSQVNPLF
jgi:hypothetical protein